MLQVNRTLWRLPLRRALILAAFLPSAALSGPLDGVYDVSEEACGKEFSDGRITIAEPDIFYHESSCTMANGQPLEGFRTAWVYDLTCQGEGDTWSERAILSLVFEGDRLIHLSDGYGYEALRCR